MTTPASQPTTAAQPEVPAQPGPPTAEQTTVDALTERLFEAGLGAIDLMSIYLGERLGLYRALDGGGSLTAEQVAARTGVHERYVREWLEQQAVTGLLGCDASGRTFTLPEATREVMLDEHSLAFLAPLGKLLVSSASQMPALLEAYRTGGGVSWSQFGADMREAQASMNRPWFEHRLGEALAGVPDVDRVLRRPGARIADLGCGGGWSSIALARAYPDATVEGFDVDEPSIEMAMRHAAEADVADRARFHHVDVGSSHIGGGYDGVFAFECVHDLARPVDFLAMARRATAPGGVTIVMDEAVHPEFSAPGDDLERFMYGVSLVVCLPDGMSSQPSAATGTVMREGVLRRYARDAGFSDLAVLPIEDFSFFRFYRLV